MPDVLVRYIIMDVEAREDESVRMVYEIKLEFKRFDFYLRIRMDRETRIPTQEHLVVGGLVVYQQELRNKVIGVLWHKIVELASQFQNYREIRKIESGRHQMEGILIPE